MHLADTSLMIMRIYCRLVVLWYILFLDDQNVTRAEFATSWVTNLRLGGTSEAEMLFDRADATDDGIVTLTDLPFIFNFFDMDRNY